MRHAVLAIFIIVSAYDRFTKDRKDKIAVTDNKVERSVRNILLS